MKLDNWRARVESFVGSVMVLVFLSAFVAGLGVVAYQIYLWLRQGTWQELPFVTFFVWAGIDLSPLDNMRWQGVLKIIVWILELPLSVMLFVSGVMLGFLILYIYNSISASDPEKARP